MRSSPFALNASRQNAVQEIALHHDEGYHHRDGRGYPHRHDLINPCLLADFLRATVEERSRHPDGKRKGENTMPRNRPWPGVDRAEGTALPSEANDRGMGRSYRTGGMARGDGLAAGRCPNRGGADDAEDAVRQPVPAPVANAVRRTERDGTEALSLAPVGLRRVADRALSFPSRRVDVDDYPV